MADVFTSIEINQIAPDRALITWELDPQFTPSPPYVFTVQGSASGNPQASDWVDIGLVPGAGGGVIKFTDKIQRSWSLVDPYFFRVKIEVSAGTFVSMPVSSTYGTISRADKQMLKNLYSQFALYMDQGNGGRCGLLYRRKNWGQVAQSVNPDTLAIANPMSTEDYGTGYVGGYHPPFIYCISAEAGTDWSSRQTELDTQTAMYETGRALAWPIPRKKDVWVDKMTGWRYYIEKVTELTRIRSVPVHLMLELRRAAPTDIIHRLPLPQ